MVDRVKVPDHSKIVIYGASGHAKVVIDALEKQGRFELLGLLDDNPKLKNKNFFGYRVFGGKQELHSIMARYFIVAIGDNRIRHEIASFIVSKGYLLTDAVLHPSTSLGRAAAVGKGTVIMGGCVINSDTNIGENSIVNTGARVDHDCQIGNSVHIAPGATLCGGVRVEELSLIGAGAVICPNVRIGKNVIVGAGTTVLDDVADNQVVVGTPAAAIK